VAGDTPGGRVATITNRPPCGDFKPDTESQNRVEGSEGSESILRGAEKEM